MNDEQAKHLAGTLRTVAFAQFALYGYTALQRSDWVFVIVSTVAFVWFELMAFLTLEGIKNG